jgi:hypothetical protein
MNAILLFTIATIINIILSTIRSLCTIKGGKMISAITNAVCYGFYPLIVMLTAKDTVSIITNMAITAIANFVCVYVIKMVEEKARKDKLWKFECTILKYELPRLQELLRMGFYDIPYNYIDLDKYYIVNFYCATQEQSADIKRLLENCNFEVKYFVSESKL